MRRALVLLMACGNDVGVDAIDAAGVGGPPGSPMVVVTSPRLNESFYPTQSITVTWSASDPDGPIACDVTAGEIAIATDVPTTSAAATYTMWNLTGVAPGMYRITVACTDANNLTGAGLSPAFYISAPPAIVSYASQIQPLWTASCTSNACHDATMPADGVNLTPSASYAELASTSGQCAAYKLVEPGAPERSYILMKLQGSGPCYMPSRMPKGAPAFPAERLQLIRDWIFNGAPNN